MATVTKRSAKIRFEFVRAKKQSILGGLPVVEALPQRLDLWRKIRALPGIDPRVRTAHGYTPELIVAQFLYCCFCWGGASLVEAEGLNDEPLAWQMARVERFADQTQLGEWLRKQSPESVAAFWELISEFVRWVIAQAPRTLDLRRMRRSFLRRHADRSVWFQLRRRPDQLFSENITD